MSPIATDNLPHDIRLIAAVSRLLDIHQSRRETGGASVPEVPEKAGFNLFLSLSIIDALREIEIDRGMAFAPLSELAGHIKKRIPEVSDSDIEYCITNLKHGREIHYGVTGENGEVRYARTWDSTTLVELEEGFSQIRLTENARLLLRVSSLKDSWLYSDLDADRLIKAIERGQFQDVPAFCRTMTIDLSAKSKQLSGALERPSLSELRSILISDGQSIAKSLSDAAETIGRAIEMIFSDHVQAEWNKRPFPGFHLGNLQADLELVLQNVKSLSRRFVQFLAIAQKVRSEGIETIKFIELTDSLVRYGNKITIERTESILNEVMPWGVMATYFFPSFLVGEADFKEQESPKEKAHGFMVNPLNEIGSSRFLDFLKRNREVLMQQLSEGPLSFSEMITLTGFSLEPGESMLDLFGVYASPGLLTDEKQRIVVGLTAKQTRLTHAEQEITGSDPLLFIEDNNDPF